MSKKDEELLKQMDAMEGPKTPVVDEPKQEISAEDEAWYKDLEAQDAERKKYSDQKLEALGLSAAGAATFGLSTKVLDALGLSKEEQEKIRRYNKPEEIGGQIIGTVGSALLPGGILGTAAKTAAGPARAAMTAGQMAERAVLSTLKNKATKSAVKDIVSRSAAKGIGSSVEGGLLSTGLLMDEAALGRADLNAENLMAYGGLGALWGGAIGTALPALGGSIAASAKAGKSVFGRSAAKYLDPLEDQFHFAGLKPKDRIAHRQSGSMQQDIKEWYQKLNTKAGVQKNNSNEVIAQKIDDWNVKNMNELDTIYREAAETSRSRIGSEADLEVQRQLKQVYLNRIEEQFDDLISERIGAGWKSSAAGTQFKKFKKYLAELRKDKSPFFEPEDIRRIRNQIDEYSSSLARKGKNKSAGVFFETRRKVAQTLERYMDDLDPKLAKRLREVNRDSHLYLTYGERMRDHLLRDKTSLSFRDAFFGGIGYGVGGELGLLAAGVKKILESDVKRKVVALSNVERASKGSSSKLNDSVEKFFKGKSQPARISAVSTIMAHEIAEDQEGNKPKTRKEALKNASAKLDRMANDPEELEARVARATSVLSVAAPKTAAHAAEALTRASLYLNARIPKPPTSGLPFGREDWEPSSLEMAKFERYFQVVSNPLSVAEELEQGTLTREHVEALRDVYPALYEEFQIRVLSYVESKPELPYRKRLQLGILLDIPTDSSLTGSEIAALQGRYAMAAEEGAAGRPTNPAGAVSVSRARAVEKSTRMKTETERISNKE